MPYIHYDYNIEQYLDHLKNLKIKKTNNLYNLRMNIIFNITGKIFHPSAKSPDILKRKLLTHVFKFH